jgi:hypothetical protein
MENLLSKMSVTSGMASSRLGADGFRRADALIGRMRAEPPGVSVTLSSIGIC